MLIKNLEEYYRVKMYKKNLLLHKIFKILNENMKSDSDYS